MYCVPLRGKFSVILIVIKNWIYLGTISNKGTLAHPGLADQSACRSGSLDF